MRLAIRSGLIATALAIAVVAAPAASAGTGAGQTSISPWAGPLALQRSPATTQSPTPTPTISPWAGPLALAHETSGSVKVPPIVVHVSAPSNGFHYGDAAVGAGVIAGLTLLGVAGALTVRRRGELRHP
jgi:hypothetical protein